MKGSNVTKLTEKQSRKKERAEQKSICRELKKRRKECKREYAKRKKEDAKKAREKAKNMKDLALYQNEDLLKDQHKQHRAKRHTSKKLLDAISLERAFEDGIWESEPGVFSIATSFHDVSYQSAPDNARRRVLIEYERLMNSLTPDYGMQVLLVNKRIPGLDNERQFYSVEDPDLRPYVNELNKVLSRQMQEGVSNLIRERYFIFSTSAPNYREARRKLAQVEREANDTLESIGSFSKPLNGVERLKLMQTIANPKQEFTFDYEEYAFAGGPEPLEAVMPGAIDFHPSAQGNYFHLPSEGIYMSALAFDNAKYGKLQDSSLAEIASLDVPLAISVHLQPISPEQSMEDLDRTTLLIDSHVSSEQEKAAQRRHSPDLISKYAKRYKEAANEAENQLRYADDEQREFYTSGVVLIWSETPEGLKDSAEKVSRAAAHGGIRLLTLDEMQLHGLNSALPLGISHLPYERRFFSYQAALFAPFIQEELWDEGGIYIGKNANTSNLTFIARWLLTSPGGFVLGRPGAGKSFSMKQDMSLVTIITQAEAEARARKELKRPTKASIVEYARENPTAEIFTIDVKASEYSPLVQALPNAEEIVLYPSRTEAEAKGGKFLNPLDLPVWMQLVSGNNPIASQLELLLAIFSQSRVTSGGENTITSVERTILDRCIRSIYEGFEDISKLEPEDVTPDKMPTFSDLHAKLLEQPEEEASSLASYLELYTTGSFDSFNHASTFDFGSRFISFNVAGLGEEMRTFSLLVILNTVMNRMYYNFKRGVRTYIYIDEVQALFTSKYVVRYFEKFWSEGRAYGAIPTGMSQNVERILSNEHAKFMIKNSGYLLLFEQADDEYKALMNLLELSAPQAKHIKPGVKPGHGLVRAGGMTVPIKGEIPEECSLYTLWNTKAQDILEEKRKEFFEANRARENSPAKKATKRS